MKRYLILLAMVVVMLFAATTDASAQGRRQRVYGASAARWTKQQSGDSVLCITLLPVKIRAGVNLQEHERMVRAVKKVYPLAVDAARRLEKLDKELEKFDLKKDRRAYTRAVEEAIKEEITPMLWKMTRYEGKILIKLIDRECNQTGFDLIKVFMGSFKANFYQTFAALFGASLKKEYDPEIEDAEIEEIIFWIDNGAL